MSDPNSGQDGSVSRETAEALTDGVCEGALAEAYARVWGQVLEGDTFFDQLGATDILLLKLIEEVRMLRLAVGVPKATPPAEDG